MYEQFPRSAKFRYDRFGMFIHFGLYAIPATPSAEWCRGLDRMSDAEYMSYFNSFNPTAYNPREWARMAKAAGMKYMVMTAKHHDGFCLFDSALTDFKATNTPYGRDLTAEFVEACRAEGLGVGLYYSLIDWNHPAYPAYHHHSHPHRDDEAYKERRPFSEYLGYMHGQVRELCTNYGKIDIMWFDYSYGEMVGEKWEATKLVNMVRTLQPGIILDNRLETGGNGFGSLLTGNPSAYSGDFVSPECIIPPRGIVNAQGEPVPWEACVTMNDHWGYSADDSNFKSASLIIRKLLECVSKGGNLLLNIGPDATGRFPDASVAVLGDIGKWMRRNAGCVYGGGFSSLEKPEWGRYVYHADTNTLYAAVTEPPIGPLPLLGLKAEDIEAVYTLADGAKVPLYADWRTDNYPGTVYVEPRNLTRYDDVCTVFRIVLKS